MKKSLEAVNSMETDTDRRPELIQIDLDAILRQRVPPSKRWLASRPVRALLKRIVRQKELNHILREAYPAEGSQFASKVLEILNISIDVRGMEILSRDERYIFASNHPLGGLDGITLISVLGQFFGDDNIRFQVNDLLMNVAPLRPVFLAINKYGSQGRASARAINDTFASDKQTLIFPAGLVSRLGKEGIRDLKWHKAFVAKALEFDRTIVPVHFEARNSMFFYRTALLRKKLGIPVNIEQALLPSELCKASGAHFTITFGKPIPPAHLRADGGTPTELAARIRESIYFDPPGLSLQKNKKVFLFCG